MCESVRRVWRDWKGCGRLAPRSGKSPFPTRAMRFLPTTCWPLPKRRRTSRATTGCAMGFGPPKRHPFVKSTRTPARWGSAPRWFVESCSGRLRCPPDIMKPTTAGLRRCGPSLQATSNEYGRMAWTSCSRLPPRAQPSNWAHGPTTPLRCISPTSSPSRQIWRVFQVFRCPWAKSTVSPWAARSSLRCGRRHA